MNRWQDIKHFPFVGIFQTILFAVPPHALHMNAINNDPICGRFCNIFVVVGSVVVSVAIFFPRTTSERLDAHIDSRAPSAKARKIFASTRRCLANGSLSVKQLVHSRATDGISSCVMTDTEKLLLKSFNLAVSLADN